MQHSIKQIYVNNKKKKKNVMSILPVASTLKVHSK